MSVVWETRCDDGLVLSRRVRQRRPPPPYLSHINVETATASASGVTGKGLRSSCQGSCDEGTLCQLDLPVLEQQDNNKRHV